VRAALERLCAVHGLSMLMESPLVGIGIGQKEMRHIRAACNEVMEALRPDALALVDAFDIPDRVLNSTIGRADGNIYEALFEATKKSLLNQVDPFVGYDTALRPHLDLEFLRNGNKPWTKNGAVVSKL